MAYYMFKGQVQHLLLIGLILASSLGACKKQTLETWQLKYQSTLSSELFSHDLNTIQNIPPRNLLTFEAIPIPELDVLSTLHSTDKYGNKRLQVYLYANPTKAISPSDFRGLIEHHRKDYAAVWLYLTDHPKAPYQSRHWQAQVAWFAPHIPHSQHQHGFAAYLTEANLYWTVPVDSQVKK